MQAESAAALAKRRGKEGVEDLLQMLGANPTAIVFDGEFDDMGLRSGGDDDRALLAISKTMAQRVINQLGYHVV